MKIPFILLFWLPISSSFHCPIRSRLLKQGYIFQSLSTSSSNPILFDRYRDYDVDKKPGGRKLILAFVAGIGIFGVGFLGPINGFIKDFMGSQRQDISKTSLKKSSEELSGRGSLTRLTRREINSKLAQIPIFFVENGDGTVYINGGTGLFFVTKLDAEKFAQDNNLKSISATTLDDVYFTLLEKKTKLGSDFIQGVTRRADPTAAYILVSSPTQLQYMSQEWKNSHANDLPLYRVKGLAFSKEEGLELPLFLRKEDALTSYNRLLESKKRQSEEFVPLTMETIDGNDIIQVTSLKDLIFRFTTGGFEGRSLEIYPDVSAVSDAMSLMTNSVVNQ